jgi:hypothetical protein
MLFVILCLKQFPAIFPFSFVLHSYSPARDLAQSSLGGDSEC